ncbi:MAG: PHP domain-containing protein [Oscillospiraceae bacterium]|nr:PHP domain-containing protein [Oscillospiraceae bacterium]
MRADLHCHTTLSDGSLGIGELISQAKRNKLDWIAITDHDTLSSSSRAQVLGKRHGVNVLPAVEISTYDGVRRNKVHLLCYNPKNPDRLEGLCFRTLEARKNRGLALANKVIKIYPTITLENIAKYASGSKAIYKCHIMHALMDYGYTTELYGEVYHELFSADRGLCKEIVKNEIDEYPEVKFVSRLIHSAGGIAVLAHPTVYGNLELLEELASNGLIDGVEVWHRSIVKRDDSEKLKEHMLEIAKKYDLITTGGSDFHGFYNHYATSPGDFITPPESLERILQFKKSKIV